MQVPGISMRNTRRIYLFPVYHMGRIYAFKNLLHFWRILLICELQFLYCSSGINTLMAAGSCFSSLLRRLHCLRTEGILRADRLFAAAFAFSVGSVRSQVLRLDIVGKLYL